MNDFDTGEAPREIRNVQIVDGAGERVKVAVLSPQKQDEARTLGILDESKGYPSMLYDDALAHGFIGSPPALNVEWRKEAEYGRNNVEPPREIF
jgi:hypothetical protein